jgi:hypothetical protein
MNAVTTIPQAIADTLVDPKAYGDGRRIDEAFTWMRANAPFEQVHVEGCEPFWSVTRHADILAIERQNDLFHNGDKSAVFTTIEADRRIREMMGGSPHLVRSLVQMDNPDHMDYRRLTQGNFLPQNLRPLEARIRELARETVNKMADMGGECDFARDIALLYPLRVVMEVLGVPPEDEPRMLKLTQELFGASDPDTNRSGQELMGRDVAAGLADMQATVMDFMMYFSAMTEDRRKCPRNDVASVIANGEIRGCPIGHIEAMGYYIIVATAGHDTTSNTVSGALWALAERPDEFRRLKNDLSLIPSMLEESIRWETPVKHFMRTATADTEFNGRKIAKGDWLMLHYPSGNRDEAVFDDAFAFKIDRGPNKHLAFGYGAHVCLGQHLARMEMRILWEELLPRLKSVELAGIPKRVEAAFVSGPKTVPIRYVMN